MLIKFLEKHEMLLDPLIVLVTAMLVVMIGVLQIKSEDKNETWNGYCTVIEGVISAAAAIAFLVI